MDAHLLIDPTKLAEFCRRRRIRTLDVFGSVLRGDFGSASDVDLLVEFEPKNGLKPLIRPEVLANARALYAA